MSGRFTKQEPKLIWFLDAGESGYYGPYVNKPRHSGTRAKAYLLTEIPLEEADKIAKEQKKK